MATTTTTKKPSKLNRLFTNTKKTVTIISSSSSEEAARHSNNDDASLSTMNNEKQQQQQSSNDHLRELCARLQRHVEIRDRTYHLKTHRQCFVGSEAVDYLVKTELVPTRVRAVRAMNDIMTTFGTIVHVAAADHRGGGGNNDKPFIDGYHFYRFVTEEMDTDALLTTTFQRMSSAIVGGGSLPSSFEIMQEHGESSGSPSTATGGKGGGDGGDDRVLKMDKYGFLLDEKEERGSTKTGVDVTTATTTTTTTKINIHQLKAEAKKWDSLLGKASAKTNKHHPNNNNNGRHRVSHGGGNGGGGGGGEGGIRFDLNYSTNPSKVKHRTRRGLPDGMRRRAWTTITGVDLIVKSCPSMYEGLVNKAREEYDRFHRDACAMNDNNCSSLSNNDNDSVNAMGIVLETIDRDINRTYPKHYLFSSAGGLEESNNKDDDDAHEESTATESGSEVEHVIDHCVDEDDDNDEVGGDIDNVRDNANKEKIMFDESMDALITNISCGDCNGTTTQRRATLDSVRSGESEISGATSENDSVHIRATLPVEELRMGQGQSSLRRVLRAYSMYDTDVGYCQGMNFIAAMFLTFLTEEESFWLLVVVMNEEPYKLREMFGEDMAGTHEVLYIAEKLIAQFLPKLSKQLEIETIHVSMFLTSWLMTVYASTFPFDLVVRVWDSFLVEGWKVVYRVMLSLLDHASQDLKGLRFEQILNYFRDFPSKIDGKKIMMNSFKIPLKSKHIQNHVLQWRRQQAAADNSAKLKRIISGESMNSGIASVFSNGSKDNVKGYIRRQRIGGEVSIEKLSVLLNKDEGRLMRQIEIEDLSEMLLPVLKLYKFAVMLHNVLSTEECSELIDRAEEKGFKDAKKFDVQTKSVQRMCTRHELDFPDLAEELYKQITHALKGTPFEPKLKLAPPTYWSKEGIPHMVGLNEHLRLDKYKHGQFYRAHTDASFVRSNIGLGGVGDMSCMSVYIFLNQNYKGGLTTFRSDESRHLDIQPRTGSMLIFEHDILHEAQSVSKGKKYLLRTDIMYSSHSDDSKNSVVSGTTQTEQL